MRKINGLTTFFYVRSGLYSEKRGIAGKKHFTVFTEILCVPAIMVTSLNVLSFLVDCAYRYSKSLSQCPVAPVV